MASSMTCIEISTPGGPDVLVEAVRARPVPGPGEVLIQVAAAGVNRPDVIQRQGRYPAPPGASDIPGLEVAGTIAGVGAGVTEWRVGESVCALLTGGGYAEYAVTASEMCMPVPPGLDMVQAAALPETFFTVWHNVFERGDLKPGETLLVHGGSSGIGTTAIQIARALGATVFTTAGSADKCRACADLGARAINYREEDYVEVIKAEAPEGVDVVLDMVGGSYIARDVRIMATEGRHVSIAFLGGSKVAEFDFMPVMLKRLTLTGSTLRAQPVENKARIAKGLATSVWPLVEDGVIRPIIHATFPLREAAKAHAMMEGGEHIGKIVLTV
ncbi:NAD(P)H-quinone oxidoreductase [Novispirillum sp. DQ9]|uniref:NAD(P)H-quinone oxidoreductase n=1 Tax=Novispirillum sp. DQ9 TaxID=3398612 RepID=UPI003C7DA440